MAATLERMARACRTRRGLRPAGLFLALLCVCAPVLVQALLISRTITFSNSGFATFTDWTTPTDITTNPGQFSTDAQGTSDTADLDYQVQATGRDLRKFAFTWDNTNLYMYVERWASTNNATDWWFFLDSSNDGKLQTGEKMLYVSWNGNNGATTRRLCTYLAADALGDPLACPGPAGPGCAQVGSADGYDMPGSILKSGTTNQSGSISDCPTQSPTVVGGGSSGVQMETYIPWASLGFAGPTSVGFHIGASNGQNFSAQTDDNMQGVGGNALSFADPAMVSKTTNSPNIAGDSDFTFAITVTNNSGSTVTNMQITDVFPSGVTWVSDNSATLGTSTAYTVGTGTLVWTIPSLPVGNSLTLVIVAHATAVLTTSAKVNSASITAIDQGDTDSSNNTVSVNFNVVPSPEFTVLKTQQLLSDPVNGVTSPYRIPGAVVEYTLSVSNSGAGAADVNTIEFTDPVATGTDLYVEAAGTPFVFVEGTPGSGLSFNFTNPADTTDDVDFSSTGCSPADWTAYNPAPAAVYDPAVNCIRITPSGTFNANAGTPPSFQFKFRVRVDP